MQILFVFLMLFLSSTSAGAIADEYKGRVIGITDGDTITVLMERGPVRIRMADIDAPEKKQPFGQKAKQFLSNEVFNKEVVVDCRGYDRYGRMIAEIRLPEGENVNKELVRLGYAHWYSRYSKDYSYNILEQEARNNKRGIWIDLNPVAPWDYRHDLKAGKLP